MGKMFINEFRNNYQKLGSQLLQMWSQLTSCGPAQWLIHNKDYFASALYMLWIVGCGYWVYTIATISVKPAAGRFYITDNPKEALVYLFFGIFALIYILMFTIYLLKFIYNLFMGEISSIFSLKWYSVAKFTCYIIALCFAFIYVEEIKASGLTVYNHVAKLWHTSKQHEVIINEDTRHFLDIIINRTKQ